RPDGTAFCFRLPGNQCAVGGNLRDPLPEQGASASARARFAGAHPRCPVSGSECRQYTGCAFSVAFAGKRSPGQGNGERPPDTAGFSGAPTVTAAGKLSPGLQ